MLEQLTHIAAQGGVAVSAQAIDQRLNPAAADLLKYVVRASLDDVIASDPIALTVRQRFTSVRIHDHTISVAWSLQSTR